MLYRNSVRTLLIVSLGLLIPVSAFCQYGGGATTGSTGGASSGTGVYTNKGGYSSSTGIAIGAGAAAGLGLLYLAMHKTSLVGCLEPSTDGLKLMSEKDKNTYALIANGQDLKAGERVELKGKKIKAHSGARSFRVQKVAHDFGSCTAESAAKTQ